MKLFHIIDDVQCITLSRGVYYQRKVYHRGKDLYIQQGAGFVRLLARGGTSAPNVSWKALPEHADISNNGGVINAPMYKGDDQ